MKEEIRTNIKTAVCTSWNVIKYSLTGHTGRNFRKRYKVHFLEKEI
jgi:hypothetical protein